MKTYKKLYQNLCSFENLKEAYEKAKRHKNNNLRVIEFAKHWQLNLLQLKKELENKTYKPLPLKNFVLHDPTTRVISVSDFRDRVVHHAIINILQTIFEPRFIHDSYASRKGKGTLPAVKRFESFLRKASRNGKPTPENRNANAVKCYALKADIYHYFETVDHEILLKIIGKYVKDDNVLWLIRRVLENHNSGIAGKGMPLGNWTSQFFANVYLNELDQFVKHNLKTKFYIRYVDDFVILHTSKAILQKHETLIHAFLKTLKLELHPGKCKIIPLARGISLLGYRVFYHYKLVRRKNLRKIMEKLQILAESFKKGAVEYWDILEVLQGWNAYAKHANTYNLRKRLLYRLQTSLAQAQPLNTHILNRCQKMVDDNINSGDEIQPKLSKAYNILDSVKADHQKIEAEFKRHRKAINELVDEVLKDKLAPKVLEAVYELGGRAEPYELGSYLEVRSGYELAKPLAKLSQARLVHVDGTVSMTTYGKEVYERRVKKVVE